MELALIKEIKEFGLEATVAKFNLTIRDYGHKILLKYSQIESQNFQNNYNFNYLN